MNIPQNYLYFAYDGDGIGRKVGQAILANDIDKLRHISNLIEAGHALVQKWVKDRNGVWINGGGDEGNAAIAKEYVKELEQLRKDYEYLVGATMSIGVGKLPSEAGRALLIAKLLGKNRIIVFSNKIEKEIKAIKKRARKGAFKSMEEYKLANAYLEKSEQSEDDCSYCQQSDGLDPDHCKYCHDKEVAEEEEKCPYCNENEANETIASNASDDPDCPFCQEMDEQAKDDCPYCKTHADGPGTSPDSNNDVAPAGSEEEKAQYEKMGMNPPIIGKPNPAEEPPIGQNPPMDTIPKEPSGDLPGANTALPADSAKVLIGPEDNHSKEALNAIAQQIEKEGTPTIKEADAIDDTDLPHSTAVEQNVSRPEDFGQNQPQDMGLGGPNPPDEPHDEPDLSEVLMEGLDHYSEGIQKERAIQIIGQAINQFRASKNELEAIKLQSPQLYRSCISILKAMIEMANMLGLREGATVPSQPALGEQQKELMPPPTEESQNEWNDPFPTHPDFGGKAKPGHAPSKNNPERESAEKEGSGTYSAKPIGSDAVGQPIGKLSAKHTTKHVARTPTPPGAVNAKGQQKVIDPKTGKTRWIDRKEGMVQSTTGVPIKPPKRGNEDGPHN